MDRRGTGPYRDAQKGLINPVAIVFLFPKRLPAATNRAGGCRQWSQEVGRKQGISTRDRGLPAILGRRSGGMAGGDAPCKSLHADYTGEPLA
jgi:hypothetical protein